MIKNTIPQNLEEWLLAIITLPTIILASPVVIIYYVWYKIYGHKVI